MHDEFSPSSILDEVPSDPPLNYGKLMPSADLLGGNGVDLLDSATPATQVPLPNSRPSRGRRAIGIKFKK